MLLSAKTQHGPVAIDVGAAAVRAVQFERRAGQLALRHWWQTALPAGEDAPVAGGPAERRVRALPSLDREAFVGNEVVISLSPPEVECVPLRVPENLLKLDHQALVAAIGHEVSRSVSVPIEQAEMDVWRLASGQMESPNLMVAAVRREVVLNLLDWLAGQGLVCRRVDIGPLVALRACSRMSPGPAPNQLWGVLDVGRSAVRLYIGIGPVPVYVRCMNRGGDEMTRRISEELNIPRSVAESYKRHYGVHSADEHYRPLTTEDAVDSHRMASILMGVLRPMIRSIGEEIQRSFRYAMGLYPDRPISGLWLIGGGSNLTGFPEMLADMLGISVHRTGLQAWPSELVAPAGLADETVADLVGCLGLGLGEVG